MKLWQPATSPERREVVFREISDGSEPAGRFYIMVGVSTMIASLGLMTSSTAVVIGAMLVAPLMTPIFGIALALIRSDTELFIKAATAEVAGVAVAILMGILLGWFYPALEWTPEIISRTEPQLLDLLVAVFSGFAGAYALMDEKISPALPGVAIATAIVPPLANAGLCFSAGQFIAGIGSFILFFANFLSILLIASATFWLFGMAEEFEKIDKRTFIKRFSFPIISFVLVTAFLTHTLLNIAKDRYLNNAITSLLETELVDYQDATLDSAKYHEEGSNIYVVADISSSGILSPTQVDRLQESLRTQISPMIKLIVKSRVAREITPLDSSVQLSVQQADGSFVREFSNPRARDVKAADTLIRNYFTKTIGLELDNVRVFEIENSPTFVASIYGISAPDSKLIEDMENLLREKMEIDDLRLVVSFIQTNLFDRSGAFRMEFSSLTPSYNFEDNEAVEQSIALLEQEVANISNNSIKGMNYKKIDGILYVMTDVSGPEMVTNDQVKRIEEKVSKATGLPIKLFVYAKAESVVTSEGYETYSAASRAFLEKQGPALQKEIREILETSHM